MDLGKGDLELFGFLEKTPPVDFRARGFTGLEFLAELGDDFHQGVERLAFSNVDGRHGQRVRSRPGGGRLDSADLGIDQAWRRGFPGEVPHHLDEVARSKLWRRGALVFGSVRVVDRSVLEDVDPDAGVAFLEDQFAGCGMDDGPAKDPPRISRPFLGIVRKVREMHGGKGEWIRGGCLKDGVMIEVGHEHPDLDQVPIHIGGLAGDGLDPDPGMDKIGRRNPSFDHGGMGDELLAGDGESDLETLAAKHPTSDDRLEFDPAGIPAARE